MARFGFCIIWFCTILMCLCERRDTDTFDEKCGALVTLNGNTKLPGLNSTISDIPVSMKPIVEEIIVPSKTFQGVAIDGNDFVGSSKSELFRPMPMYQKYPKNKRLRAKRSSAPESPQNALAETTTGRTDLYIIDRNKTDKQIVIDTHSFVCGRKAMCSSASDYRICGFDCLSCYCDIDCNRFGDCCPDFDQLDVSSETLLEPYHSCISYNWTKLTTIDRMVMVAICPENYTGSFDTVNKCENADFTIKQEATPVSDQSGLKVYKNIFCATCHAARNTTTWIHDVTCVDSRLLADAKSETEMWSRVVTTKTCSVKSYPSNGMFIQRCFPPYISTCADDGVLSDVNAWTKPLCESYTNPVQYDSNQNMYRNIFCALCNGISLTNTRSDQCTGHTEPDLPFPLSVLLRFTSQSSYQQEDSSPEICPLGETEDLFTDNCRSLQCQETHRLESSDCVKRYSSGVGIGIRVDVLLSSDKTLVTSSESVLGNRFAEETQMILRQEQSPLVTTKIYIRIVDRHPISLERPPIAFVRTEFVTGRQGPWSMMEDTLDKVSSLNITVELDGVLHNISTSPSICSVPDEMLKGGTELPTGMNSRSESNMGSGCRPREIDCLANVYYMTVFREPKCPFVSYNTTLLDIAYNATTHEIIVEKNTFKVSASDVNMCGDTLIICAAAIKEIRQEGKKLRVNVNAGDTASDSTLTIVSLVCLSISLLGLVLTFSVYASHKKLRTVPGQIILVLVTYLFCAQFLFLLGSNWRADRILCQGFGIAIHFFWVASFSWMVASAVHMMLVFTHINSSKDQMNGPRHIIRYTIICNAVAIIFVGSCLAYYLGRSKGMESGYGGAVCFLNKVEGVGLFFAIPLFLMLLINSVCFFKTIRAIKAVPDMSSASNKTNKNYIFVYFKLSILLGFSWVFGIGGSLLESKVLEYIFTVLTGGQGAFIFISFCFNNRVLGMVKSSFSTITTTSIAD